MAHARLSMQQNRELLRWDGLASAPGPHLVELPLCAQPNLQGHVTFSPVIPGHGSGNTASITA